MQVFPELNTNRLKLRKLTVEDIPSLVKYANNKKIADNVLNIPYPYREPDAVFRISYVHQGFKSKSRYVFAIILQQTEELVGETSLHLGDSNGIAQLAYWIAEPFWNKGIATEAVDAIVKFGFEKLRLNVIYADCNVENKASQKVLLNNKMKNVGVDGNIMHFRLVKEAFDNDKHC